MSYVTVNLTQDQNYLLNSLLRGHIKDLGDFTNAEQEIAFAKRLLKTLAEAKVSKIANY